MASPNGDRIDSPRVPGSYRRLGLGASAPDRAILRTRTHRSLDEDAPVSRPVQRVGSLKTFSILGGLHHHYLRVGFSVHSARRERCFRYGVVCSADSCSRPFVRRREPTSSGGYWFFLQKPVAQFS